eukprot:1134421-Pyramimonas_sp.AAC.1
MDPLWTPSGTLYFPAGDPRHPRAHRAEADRHSADARALQPAQPRELWAGDQGGRGILPGAGDPRQGALLLRGLHAGE